MPKTSEDTGDNVGINFWEHTQELANRLKIVLYTLVISTAVMLVFPADLSILSNPLESYVPFVAVILGLLREEVLPPNVTLIGLKLTAPIELYFIASFIFALAITIPVFAYETFKFIEPALHPHEKRDVYPFVAAISILFVIGAMFSYKVLTPHLLWAIFPFFTAVGAEFFISIMDFYSILFITTLITGFAFTFPVFFVLLVKYGILGTGIIRNNRRYVYVGLFIFAMILSPNGGFPVGNLMIWSVFVLLLETGVLFARRYEKKDEPSRIRWLPKGKSCKFCGKSISSDTAFCTNCGKAQD